MAYPPKIAFERLFERLNEKIASEPDNQIADKAWKTARNWLAGYSSWRIPYNIKSADNMEWRIPHRGLENLILQIEKSILEEYKRRDISSDIEFLTDPQLDGVLAKFGHFDLVSEYQDLQCDTFTKSFNFTKLHPVAQQFLSLKIPDYFNEVHYKG